MTCSYQYILKAPVETEQADAEAYCATSLESGEKSIKEESISIYGIVSDSAYLSLPEGWKGAYVNDDVAAKYHLKEGDTLTLHNAYDKDETHDFTVSGTYNSPGTMAIYLPIDDFREEFNQDAAYFNGYFSNEELTDLDEHMVASVITEDDLTKVSRQLENSMGNMMSLFIGFGVVMFLLLMYLLIKLIIEKNAQSISMRSRTALLGGNHHCGLGIAAAEPAALRLVYAADLEYLYCKGNERMDFLLCGTVHVCEDVPLGRCSVCSGSCFAAAENQAYPHDRCLEKCRIS